MDKQLLSRLIHTATHFPCTGQDGYGDKTFGQPVDRACYQEGKMTMVKSLSGEEVVSSLQLYFDTLFGITAQDEFLVDGRTHPIISYSRFDGLETGTGTTVVYL